MRSEFNEEALYIKRVQANRNRKKQSREMVKGHGQTAIHKGGNRYG